MTQPSRASESPDRIYLEPPPGSSDGRMWCEDRVEDDWVEYVRVDGGRARERGVELVDEYGRAAARDGAGFGNLTDEPEAHAALLDYIADLEARHPHPGRGEVEKAIANQLEDVEFACRTRADEVLEETGDHEYAEEWDRRAKVCREAVRIVRATLSSEAEA